MNSGSEQVKRHSWLFTLIIAMLGMVGPFTIDTVFPAFAHIGKQFGSSDVALQQITSSYLIAFAAASLFHGPVSDAVGRKKVMYVGISVYALASVGCALSPSLGWLIAFRVLQGASAGAGQIISRALIRDLYDGPQAQRLMSQVAMIFSVAPAIAPIIGGWILGVGSWPWIFWFLVVYALLMLALITVGLPETHPVEARTPLRLGSIFTSLGHVAQNRIFMRLAFAMTATFAAQFLYIVSAPIFVVRLLGKGDQDFWIFFVPMITGMMLGSMVSARLAARVQPVKLATVGFGLTVVAAAVNVSVSLLPGAPILPWAVLGPSLVAFGVALAFPIVQLAMLDLFPRQRGAAASMQSFIQLVVNALLAGLLSPLVTGSVLELALASATFSLIGIGLWVWHLRTASHIHD
ncbi:MAG TPA: multidrug effflux MFS transporter [Propionibacteriaceae bacterium]|nr:multidrug effflux MFS transporter [Propionibacteriaceae bacterium]